MTVDEERPLSDNPPGANLYLPERLVKDSVCPLNPGRRVQVITIPNTGILVLPKHTDRPFSPITDPAADSTDHQQPPTDSLGE